MKNSILLILMLISSFSLIAQSLPLQLEWTNTYNRRTASSDYLFDMKVGIKGGIYLAGDSFDAGLSGIKRLQILKYDENGDLLWERIHNGVDSTKSKTFQEMKIIDETQLFVSAVVANPTVHVLLAKYNIAGDLIWSFEKDAIHPGTPFTYKFQVTEQGNIYLIYDQGGTYPTQAVNIVKLDANAQLLWERNYSYNATSLDYVKSFEVDEDENIYLVGSTAQYDSTHVGFHEFDFFISKFDSAGQLIRQNTYCPYQSCSTSKIQSDEDNNIYISLSSNTNPIDSFCLIKVDSSGVTQFIHDFSSDMAAPHLSTFILKNSIIYTYQSIDSYHAQTQWVFIKKFNLEDSLLSVSDTIKLAGNQGVFGVDNWGKNYMAFKTYTASDISLSILDTQGITTNHFEHTDSNLSSIYVQKIHIQDDGIVYIGGIAIHTPISHRGFYLMKYNYTDTTNNYVIINTELIEKEKISVQFYPNPVTDISNIKIDLVDENTEIQIFNALGQAMPKPQKISNQHFEVHKTAYPTGIYFYSITAKGKSVFSGNFQVY